MCRELLTESTEIRACRNVYLLDKNHAEKSLYGEITADKARRRSCIYHKRIFELLRIEVALHSENAKNNCESHSIHDMGLE